MATQEPFDHQYRRRDTEAPRRHDAGAPYLHSFAPPWRYRRDRSPIRWYSFAQGFLAGAVAVTFMLAGLGLVLE